VSRALDGDESAIKTLLDRVCPAIQARVARSLLRRASAAKGRDLRQELEDLTQDVLVRLFAEHGRVLRDWNPERGMSLQSFVGLVAERHIASIMRSSRRSPWTEDPTLDERLSEEQDESATPEMRVANSETCGVILERLRAKLSPLGLHLFHALLVEEQSVEVICAETGMQRGAIYTWKNRLLRVIREIVAELEAENKTGGQA
jgi:RNA polymerase sigma-70 factor (ECF subfamily)